MVRPYAGQCIRQSSQKKSTKNPFGRLRYQTGTESEPISHTSLQCPCRDGLTDIAHAFCWTGPGFDPPPSQALFYPSYKIPAPQNRATDRNSRFGPSLFSFLSRTIDCQYVRAAKSFIFPEQ